MSTIATILGAAALAVAIASAAVADRRHKRARKRLARLEHRDAELLTLLKATAARALEPAQIDTATPVAFRSQFGEDILILELLGWPRQGSFVEVGGYDGLTNSVSSALEQLGWQGLLVEPVPELFAKAKASRPRARVVHAAVGKRGSKGTAKLRHFEGDAQSDERYDESSHLESTTYAPGTRRPPASTPARTIDVPLTTLDDLLAGPLQAHTQRIDAASIDVEGHELDVLDGFDLDRFQPAVILVEDHTRAGRGPINHALEPRRYVQVGWLAWNRVMVRRDREDVLAHARALGMHPTPPAANTP